MTADALKTKAEQGFAQQFDAGKSSLPGAGNAWADGLREAARETYAASGLPHRRVEEWKYTDLRARFTDAFPPAPVVAEALTLDEVNKALGDSLSGLDCHRLVIVDGNYRPELSDLSNLGGKAEILPLADALSQPSEQLQATLGQVNPQMNDPVIALNSALMTGGVVVTIADGISVEKPIHLVHVFAASSAASVTTRNVVLVGAKVKATLLESYVVCSDAPVQRNSVTELVVGDGSEFDHLKFQAENGDAAHLTSWMTRLGADVAYRGFQFSTGAAVARNQVFVWFAGENSSSHVSGAVLARDKQHNDTTMVIDHAVPGCVSREFKKLVLAGEARGIIQCKVNVHKDAQKSDGHQMAQALMLSETAEFDSKPELEIFADDVVCGHGSTSGQVDDELLFYLRARGISEKEARAMLVAAFVGEAIEKVENEDIREIFHGFADAWLENEKA